MKKFTRILIGVLIFVAGAAAGGYLFTNSQPRSFLAVQNCKSSCFHLNELTGLLASAGIQRIPGLIPNVLIETDKCIAITHPFPESHNHFLIFPKRDIKNIGEISLEDQAFIMDCMGVIRTLIQQKRLRTYRVYTNGPGHQDVAYLHFHLIAK